MERIRIGRKEGEAAARFLFRFLLLSAPLYIILALKLDFFPLQVAVARQVAALLGFLGFSVSVSQYLIQSASLTLEVTPECTGWIDVLAFVALVLAAEKGGKFRALPLAPVVYFANLLRLVVTFALGVYLPNVVMFAHNLLFQFAMLVFVFLLWFFCYLVRDDKV